MFDVVTEFMIQLVDWIPGYVCLFLIFDFLGTFFFGKN